MTDTIKIEAQAIVTHLSTKLLNADAQVTQMVAILAVKDARIKELEAQLEELTPKTKDETE